MYATCARPSLERLMCKMRPPNKCTGREMSDSYVTHKGPGKTPKQEKWLQHMELNDGRKLLGIDPGIRRNRCPQ
jgi:hypothetical protein